MNLVHSLIALTPFLAGEDSILQRQPPAGIAGGFPDSQALTHELKRILSQQNLTLPIVFFRRAL